MDKKLARGERLVLVPLPAQGHLNPMLQLASFLHKKGFSITIAHTRHNFPNTLVTSNYPEFIFVSIEDGLTPQQRSSKDGMVVLPSLNTNCGSSFQHYLSEQKEQETLITCIIYDEYMYFAESVANLLNIPSIILRTSSAANFRARAAILDLHSEYYLFPESDLLEPVPKLEPLRFKDMPLPPSAALEIYVKVIGDVLSVKTSSAIIWNTSDCLEESSLELIQRHCQVPIFSIGPLHKLPTTSATSSLLNEDDSCIPWLDKQAAHSVLYVSLGSVVSISEQELAEMAWGLANSNQHFLWVIRPGSISGYVWKELLPEGFEEAIAERGFIVKWAPQREVLAHRAIGGFWTHCGWNSILESMSVGVPMICRPYFNDQKVHARFLGQVWKVGLELEAQLERGMIQRAIWRLMVDEEGNAMRLRAYTLKEKIDVSTSNGGFNQNLLNKFVQFMLKF